jgi:hypothetical protein
MIFTDWPLHPQDPKAGLTHGRIRKNRDRRVSGHTLALITSIIALVLSLLACASSGREEGLNARMKDPQAAMGKMKPESAWQLNKLRNDTASAL